MLSSIIEFAMLRRAVAKHAAGQQATPPVATPAPSDLAPDAEAGQADGLEMSILKRESMFEDAPWERGGSINTICF